MRENFSRIIRYNIKMPHFARLFFFQSPRTGLRRRGATLVELAIVLVVVGILMGGALIPMRALEERRQLREETRQMERVRDAIVGYAFRHRTRARTVKFVNQENFEGQNSPSVWEFRLPAGRPYLPCPDWDGDGFEDRIPEGADGFMQGMEVKPDLTATMTIGAFIGNGTNSLFWWSDDSDNDIWYPYGECRVLRGTVPWRTLGVEPSDSWGNRHTYYADPAFSNAIFGFDRQTIADIYDDRVPEAPGFGPAERLNVFNFEYDDIGAPCPSVICDGARTDNCVSDDHSYARRTYCSLLTEVESNLILKAGAVAVTEINDGRKYFPKRSVIDGLPFVLVSHGPNGRFAVNHWASLNSPLDLLGVKGPVCNLDGWATLSRSSFIVQTSERNLIKEAVNASRISSGGDDCLRLDGKITGDSGVFRFNLSFFVWEPPGADDKNDFDDLLLWMTREELSVAVPGRIPRLPRMVVAYPRHPR